MECFSGIAEGVCVCVCVSVCVCVYNPLVRGWRES